MDTSLFYHEKSFQEHLAVWLESLVHHKAVQAASLMLCCNVSECIYTYAHTVYNNRFWEGCIYVSHTHFFHCLKIYNGTTSC